MCLGRGYDHQRTLVIRIAAITSANDSGMTIAYLWPEGRSPRAGTPSGGHPGKWDLLGASEWPIRPRPIFLEAPRGPVQLKPGL